MAGKRNKSKKAEPLPPPPEQYNDDDGLVDDLLAQLDSRDASSKQAAVVLSEVQDRSMQDAQQATEKAKKDSRARFKAREERKAAALAANYAPVDSEADAKLIQAAKDELAHIQAVAESMGLAIQEINADGHCLYSAVADQLQLLSIIPPSACNYQTTRLAAATYMISHPNEFLPFLPSAEGEDGRGATESYGFMSPAQFERYCLTVRDTGAWGGEPEIMALSRAYMVPIIVVQSGPQPVVVHSPVQGGNEDPRQPGVKISYHRRLYGLGEHYNSLRPKHLIVISSPRPIPV